MRYSNWITSRRVKFKKIGTTKKKMHFMEKKIITNTTFCQRNSMFISATFWAGLLCSEQDHKHTKKTSPRRIFADAHRDKKNTLCVSSFGVSLWPHKSRPHKWWWLKGIPIGNCLVYLLSPQKSECHWARFCKSRVMVWFVQVGHLKTYAPQYKSLGFLAPPFFDKGDQHKQRQANNSRAIRTYHLSECRWRTMLVACPFMKNI